MVWFKVDDDFYDHPKVTAIPRGQRRSALGTWVIAGSFCARYLTDGHVTHEQLRKIGGTEHDAATLVAAGLWIATAGGYQFHDWDAYQLNRARVEHERERVKKWRAAKRAEDQ